MRVSSFEKIKISSSLLKKASRELRNKIQFGKNIGRECVANLVAMNLYPLGLLERPMKAYPHPVFAENTHPILLVHGILHNHSAFIRLERKFLSLGWHNIFTLNYRTSTGSIHRMAGDLEQKVDEILKATGAPQVDIIAHSLGGLVSRQFMCAGEGRGKVRKLITLGTPHQGTERSTVLKCVPGSSLGEDLMENSYFIKSILKSPVPKNSEIISISSEFDWTSKKSTSFEAKGFPYHSFQNISYKNIGHTSLLYSEKVFRDILSILSANEVSR